MIKMSQAGFSIPSKIGFVSLWKLLFLVAPIAAVSAPIPYVILDILTPYESIDAPGVVDHLIILVFFGLPVVVLFIYPVAVFSVCVLYFISIARKGIYFKDILLLSIPAGLASRVLFRSIFDTVSVGPLHQQLFVHVGLSVWASFTTYLIIASLQKAKKMPINKESPSRKKPPSFPPLFGPREH